MNVSRRFRTSIYSKFILRLDNMENIFTVTKPFYYLSKLMGLFPMTFDGPIEKGNFSIKWHDIFASGVALLVTFVIFVFNFTADERNFSSSSVLLSKTWDVQSMLGLIPVLIMFFVQMLKRNSIVKFLQAIFVIDLKVKSFF
jgi:hypothetical protein